MIILITTLTVIIVLVILIMMGKNIQTHQSPEQQSSTSQSETITYNCPYCRKPFTVHVSEKTVTVSCPSCNRQVTVDPRQSQPFATSSPFQQPPGQPLPGYGTPLKRKMPAGIIIIAFLFFLSGGWNIYSGFVTLTSEFAPLYWALAPAFMATYAINMILGVLAIIVAFGLLILKPIARTLAIIVAISSIVMALVSVGIAVASVEAIEGEGAALQIGTLLLICQSIPILIYLIIIAYLFTAPVKAAFGEGMKLRRQPSPGQQYHLSAQQQTTQQQYPQPSQGQQSPQYPHPNQKPQIQQPQYPQTSQQPHITPQQYPQPVQQSQTTQKQYSQPAQQPAPHPQHRKPTSQPQPQPSKQEDSTYYCPHCGKPFIAQISGHMLMIKCPSFPDKASIESSDQSLELQDTESELTFEEIEEDKEEGDEIHPDQKEQDQSTQSQALTYYCPHCRKPFTAQENTLMVSCPSCGGEITMGSQNLIPPQQDSDKEVTFEEIEEDKD